MIAMKNAKTKILLAEVKCPACDGTEFPSTAQPAKPQDLPATLQAMFGKGRITPA
jgi:hypothetical protein